MCLELFEKGNHSILTPAELSYRNKGSSHTFTPQECQRLQQDS